MKSKKADDLIKEKSKEMFFSYGLRSISMDDVANLSGISKRIIYRYFEDKNALVRAVVKDLIQSHKRFFDTCQASAKDAIDEVIKQNSEPFEIWTPIRPRFFFDLENFFPGPWNDLELYKLIMLEGIVRNLKWGREEGLYSDQVSMVFIAEVRLHQLVNCLQPQLVETKKWSIHKFVVEFTRLYLQSITTVKGEKLLNSYLEGKEDL
ncbi:MULTISPECIES: TetR/AcrR family transcriptional regulator [Niastella]|uniref:TetR/AcrR family transcriptional regulator n=1 Tax=Niastella soli TaxID=2821487 RepID=A0ABS3Z1B3_9BACT|nr:TetR/AcrR family transcriptional regulator [Niastella soli]MBO9203818.1 TetR/AcrR family transcriptional regulator [Niastella soli]